jgi:hypothetical protein
MIIFAEWAVCVLNHGATVVKTVRSKEGKDSTISSSQLLRQKTTTAGNPDSKE